MFKAALLGAVALLGAWEPLSAEVFSLSINGSATGTQSTVMCGPGSAANCFSSYPGGTASQEFLKAFDLSLFPMDLAEGDTSFTWGNPRSSGLYIGIINNAGGFLTGRDLTFSIEDANCRTGALGCQFAVARAASFNVNVNGAIPEPATWAMMLLGFLAIGTAVRRNPRGQRQALAG